MTRIIHTADLHISVEEKDYSLRVLDNILQIVRERKAEYLLFAGDIFDSFTAAGRLSGPFRERMNSLSGTCETFLLAGNHEDHNRNLRQLGQLDLGIPTENIFEGIEPRCTLITRGNIEFLAVPHRKDYSDYRDWGVRAKEAGSWRIALGHGTIVQMHAYIYGSNDQGEEEEKSGVLDAEMLERLQVDYAAMGHIHAGKGQRLGAVQVVYPGSSRVWRNGEIGARSVVEIDIEESLTFSRIELPEAGQCRCYRVFADFDGTIEMPADADWKSNDMIAIAILGLVEDNTVLRATMDQLCERFRGKVRQFTMVNDEVSVVHGLISNPVAKTFLDIWERRRLQDKTPEATAAWKKAREMGLMQIKERLENQL
jgi:predicted phosphodiesterase